MLQMPLLLLLALPLLIEESPSKRNHSMTLDACPHLAEVETLGSQFDNVWGLLVVPAQGSWKALEAVEWISCGLCPPVPAWHGEVNQVCFLAST